MLTTKPENDNVVYLPEKRSEDVAHVTLITVLFKYWKPIVSVIALLILGAVVAFMLNNSGQDPGELTVEELVTERDAYESQVTTLNSQLATAVDPEVKAQLENELNVVETKLSENESELTRLETELGLSESTIETLETTLAESQAELQTELRANAELEAELSTTVSELSVVKGRVVKLQSELETEIAAIPTNLTAAMSYAQPRVETHFTVDETWKVERRLWWGLNDETHDFTSVGSAVYGMIVGPTKAEWQDTTLVVTLWLPELKDAYFRLEAVNLNQGPGFLAGYGQVWGDETDMSPLFEQAQSTLDATACSDTESLREFITRMDASITDMAGGHEVDIYWRDKFGFTHTHQAVTDQMLLASAC